ncbi:MAG TPA: hypothetical protein VM286_00985 [Candidatus Thermoplasmatota archaeon]|nr:hypothetical protein [Candidatus Thermoplasmatota archaeon]
MESRGGADGPDAGFDLLEGTEDPLPWRKVVGFLLMGGGLAALAWGFLLMLGHSDVNVPSQSPVPLQHPLELLGALGLSLALLCGGAILLGRSPDPDPRDV